MSVRLADRMSARLYLPDDLRDARVPPLLLQPLVENAIKHGLEPKVEGGRIDIRAERDGSSLRLSVRDTGVGLGDGTQPATGSQFGLQQVRERLSALYGARAELALAPAADDEGGTLATITLPLQALPLRQQADA
jgi:sensor histidine kinase YesM